MTKVHTDGYECLRRLCGEGAYPRIFMATSHRSICSPAMGEQRERELRTIWADVLRSQSTAHMRQLDETQQCAWNLMQDLLNRIETIGRNGKVFRVQWQMVEKKRKFSKTDLGKFVCKHRGSLQWWIDILKKLFV